MTIKTQQELELLRKAGRVVAETIQLMIKSVEDGMTTAELDLIGRKNIERHARRGGFSVIENLGSHGVGRALHEQPEFIAGFYDPQDRRTMHEGQVFTIEPFISTGARQAIELDDKWTLATAKKFRTAQYEHTIVVTKNSPIVITANALF